MPSLNRLAAIRMLAPGGSSDRESILRFQSAHLAALVRHVAANVPYYRRFFADRGFDARDFQGIRDLEKIPISSKDDLIYADPEELLSVRTNRTRLLARSTSGSTGRPFTVRCSRFEERYLSALRFRVYQKMGMTLRDRVAGIRYGGSRHGEMGWIALLNRLGLFRVAVLDSALSPKVIASRLGDLQPDVIRGYANLTSLVADAALEACLAIRPRLVIVGGDTLTPAMKQRIARAFQAPVREVYGSHEFNMMAWECDRSGQLHVCEEGVILEVVRDGRPVAVGEEGEVVATALHSFSQPFIRFRLGDIAIRGEAACACGLPYSTIHSITGRIYDRIVLPDGTAASPGELLSPLEREFPWVSQYQLVQESRELVRLRLVAREESPSRDLEAIDRMMERFLGAGVERRIELLDAIPLAPGEKFRASMSRVRSNYPETL